MNRFICTLVLPSLILSLRAFRPETVIGAIALTNGRWSTTLNCNDWVQNAGLNKEAL